SGGTGSRGASRAGRRGRPVGRGGAGRAALLPRRRAGAARGAARAGGPAAVATHRRPRPAGLPEEPVTDPVVGGLLTVDLGPGVRAGFTGPGNLSRTVGDQAGVLARRRALAAWAGAPVAYAWQVHGRRVH